MRFPGWIFFVRSGGIGDFILSLPLLRALRKSRPEAGLCVVGHDSYQCLLPENARPERWLSVDSAGALPFFSENTRPKPELQPLFADAAVYIFNKPDPELETSLRRHGVKHLTWLNPRPLAGPHVAEQLLTAAGMPVPRNLLETPVFRSPRPSAAKGLWLHPGSGGHVKNFPLEYFAESAKQWRRQHPAAPVFISLGPADIGLHAPAARVFADYGLRPEFVLNLELSELKQRMYADTAEYIGNDSGITHLAAALGIPVTVLFKCTSPDIWRPMGKCRIIRA